MSLPKSLTSVTPLSKASTIILLVALPFVGFYVGVQYQQSLLPKVEYISKEKVVKVQPEETRYDLVSRCGDPPSEDLKPSKQGHFTMMNGPEWSPDCRHIAWSLWESGTGVAPLQEESSLSSSPDRKPASFEGIYLYDDRTK